MTNDPKNTGSKPAQSREERLAAQLRANLRRRKAQARAMSGSSAHPADAGNDSAGEGDKD